MPRAYKTETWDLSTLDQVTGQPREIGHRVMQVLRMPDTIHDVELAVDDDAFLPLDFPYGLEACDVGRPQLTRLSVRGPQQDGLLVIGCFNDPVPRLIARPGAAASAHYLNYAWLPHDIGSSGGGLKTTGLVVGGGTFTNFLGVQSVAPGVAPVQVVRAGRPAGLCQCGAGGQSGISLAPAINWVRSRTAVGLVLTGHQAAKVQSWHLEVELMADAAGGVDGVGTGLYLVPSDGVTVNEGFPDQAVAPNAFLGVVRNGAGSWQVAARKTAGAAITLTESLATVWPAITSPVRVHLALINADAASARDGIVQVFLNEQLVKTYTDMTPFPDALANGMPGDTTYRAKVFQHGQVAQALSFANIELWTSKGSGVAQQ